MVSTDFKDVIARKRIAAARSDLIFDEPFWGNLALKLLLVERYSCETAATDGQSIFYNPKFIETLNNDELITLVKHEVMHCTNGHPWRKDGREHERWNDACDYAINQILVDAGCQLPEGGLLDQQFAGKGAEWIYDRLPPKPRKGKQPGSGQGGGGRAESTPKNGASGTQDPGSDGTENRQARPNKLGEVWDAPPDAGAEGEAPPPSEEDWRQAAVQAAALAKAQGKLPAGMERLIAQIEKPRVDWKPALRRFAQEVAQADYSFARPNARYVAHGAYLPALRSHEVGVLAIAVDTSGSVDNVMLSQFNAEISAIADEVQPREIRVLYCDARVNRQETFVRGEEIKLRACGGGGTDFRPVFEAIDQMDEQPVALLYLTDLDGTFPAREPSTPTVWVTPEGTRRKHVPFGELIVAA